MDKEYYTLEHSVDTLLNAVVNITRYLKHKDPNYEQTLKDLGPLDLYKELNDGK